MPGITHVRGMYARNHTHTTVSVCGAVAVTGLANMMRGDSYGNGKERCRLYILTSRMSTSLGRIRTHADKRILTRAHWCTANHIAIATSIAMRKISAHRFVSAGKFGQRHTLSEE